MATREDGGSAFPILDHIEFESGAHALECIEPGMTLRDWFAGQVITGVAATGINGCEDIASRAYAIADAMLAARK